MPGCGTGRFVVSTKTPPKVGAAGVAVGCVAVGGGGAGVGVVDKAVAVGTAALSTTHDLTMPIAGSLPKNSFVHWPPPLSVFEIQLS